MVFFMEKYHVPPYDEVQGKGLVRHVLVRYGFATREIMVCLVLNGRKLPYADQLTQELRRIPGMTSIMLNVNDKNTNVILGDELINLWGQDYITDCEIVPIPQYRSHTTSFPERQAKASAVSYNFFVWTLWGKWKR